VVRRGVIRVREADAKVKEKPHAGEKVSWTKGGPPALKHPSFAQEPAPSSSDQLYGTVTYLGVLSLQQSTRYGYVLSGRSFFR
jgi:hypothetical protein